MAKKSWYAWHDAEGNGGVCNTWEECQRACSGLPGEHHKGFRTYEEAWAFAYPNQQAAVCEVPSSAPASQPTPENAGMEPPWDPEETQQKTVSSDVLNHAEAENEEKVSSQVQESGTRFDYSRAEKTPVSEAVNRFCEQYRFTHLSEAQRRAVQAAEGKYLLFAVPGSGKTTVLMARTGFLIHSLSIPPKQLMTMTFTRASAKEMQKRYCDYFHPSGDQIPDFRTIHSFCFSIIIPLLRRSGFKCPFHTINEDADDNSRKRKYTQRTILTAVLKKCLDAGKASEESVQETVQTAFSCIKNREMREEEYRRYSVHIDKERYPLAPLFREYQETLRKLDCMDYDDMLVYALKGLRECPGVLKSLQNTYHYWSIDEAQDNSRIQHELMNLLAGANGNLFMVGDDDQSIYGFRGAEPGELLKFGNRPDVHLLVMGTNYRSDSGIVRAARPFIEVNHCRADKNLTASHAEPGEINIPLSFSTEAQQYEYMIEAAGEANRTHTRLGVLYQLNISALPLIVRLHRADIPFESSKGLADLLRNKSIGKILRILRFSRKPNSLEMLQDCRKNLGLYWLTDDLMDQLKAVHLREKQKPLLQIILDGMEEENARSQRVSRIHLLLQRIRDYSPSDAVKEIMLSPDLALPSEILTDRLAMYALLSVCDLYDTVPEMLEALSAMEEREKYREKEISEAEKTDDDRAVVTGEDTCVTLSTIHSAKGREWDRVMLIDSFQETFPGEPQFDRIGFDPEEARRVFYVAVTRAVHRLDILTVRLWHGNEEKVSSFVPEFAWMADQSGDGNLSETNREHPDISSSECSLVPTVYYGVPVGRTPGVYTDYRKVEEQVKGFSIPPGKQQKKFFRFEDAWAYAFPGQPIPDRSREN